MIVQGDCLDVLKDLPDGCVTAILTDPPYGLEFMGKGWDKVLPPTEVWREALRVLRPGGHALIFGGTRTYHRLACAVEDAGFEVRDCLMWLYGQGFPKSLDVSKAIDKAAGAEREIVGKSARHVSGKPEQRTAGLCGSSTFQESVGMGQFLTAPATDAAKQWAGYGTALKPAWEPILLARKPLVGTVEANCREHGTGALNIEGCRIGTDGGGTHCSNRDENGKCLGHKNAGRSTSGETFHGPEATDAAGRWPANLILDEEAGAQLDEQTGELKSGTAVGGLHRRSPKAKNTYSDYPERENEGDVCYGDSGGASRFFYCAKASKADRGEGNSHPTVKPVELMRWLVRLVKGPGENLILDPFGGSGTTGVACQLEDVPFLLIEREAAYVAIAEARIAEK